MTEDSRCVADVMSAPAVTALTSETIDVAALRMHQRRVGSLVVVDGDRVVGIITERDLLRMAAVGDHTGGAKVGEWMTASVDTVDASTSVGDALAMLQERGYRHVPVTSGGHLAGVVSARDLLRIVDIRPLPGSLIEVPRGLKGVVVAETEVGDVRGQEGFYHYRQYSAVELAVTRSFEDVWFLLFEGHLPDATERASFAEEIGTLRSLPAEVRRELPAIAAAGGEPLDGLRTALSLLGAARGMRPLLDLDAHARRADLLALCSATPTIVVALHRLRHGTQPVEPDPGAPLPTDYLRMLSGEDPDPRHAAALGRYLISTIDHGFNASTFTARVVASTGADAAACVVAAVGALSGPLHGGAPSRALDLLDEIGSADRVDEVLRGRIEGGEKMMGFGHAVYRTDDPRSVMLRDVARDLGGPTAELAFEVEAKVVALLDELKPGRQLRTNVEFYAGVVMDRCGIPRDLFTPTFASSRVIGWAANVLEQMVDNKIIRPSARYVGPPAPQPVPAP